MKHHTTKKDISQHQKTKKPPDPTPLMKAFFSIVPEWGDTCFEHDRKITKYFLRQWIQEFHSLFPKINTGTHKGIQAFQDICIKALKLVYFELTKFPDESREFEYRFYVFGFFVDDLALEDQWDEIVTIEVPDNEIAA